MILDCHREHVATTSAHASARPGARDPLHRHASLHAFLRGRELVRTASNTTLRPGVRDFVSGAPEPRAHAHDEDAFFERRAARRLFPGAGRAAEGTRDPRRRWGSVSVSEGYGAEAADDRPLAPFVVRFCRREDGSATPNSPLLAVAGEDGAVTVVDVGAPAEGFRGFGNASAFPSFEVKRRFRAHDNAVFDTRWCRGSERLVTASGDGTARLFDAETAAELGAFAFHRGTVKAVAVRPGSGGDVFASCGRDGALALWDARVASRASASVAPYGERLSLAASSKPVAVVERAHEDDHGSSRGAAKTKTKTKTKARVASVSSAAFAHDGQVLLSAGAADGLVKLWDARRLHRKTPVAAMADADPGASAGGVGRTEDLWGDATTPRRPRRGITSLALAPNGSTRVAASYSDSHIAVFDHNAPSAGPACHLRAPGRRSTFKTSFYVKTAFSPCGTHLASGSCDTAVYVWNADRPLASPAALAGHAGEVSAVDWSPAEFGRIASCADDGTARVWAVDRGFAASKGGRTDDDEDDDRSSDEDEVRVEKTRRLADATPARDASSPAGTSAPTSLRTPALFSRERSIQAYFSPRDSQW
jgi:denticleless